MERSWSTVGIKTNGIRVILAINFTVVRRPTPRPGLMPMGKSIFEYTPITKIMFQKNMLGMERDGVLDLTQNKYYGLFQQSFFIIE